MTETETDAAPIGERGRYRVERKRKNKKNPTGPSYIYKVIDPYKKRIAFSKTFSTKRWGATAEQAGKKWAELEHAALLCGFSGSLEIGSLRYDAELLVNERALLEYERLISAKRLKKANTPKPRSVYEDMEDKFYHISDPHLSDAIEQHLRGHDYVLITNVTKEYAKYKSRQRYLFMEYANFNESTIRECYYDDFNAMSIDVLRKRLDKFAYGDKEKNIDFGRLSDLPWGQWQSYRIPEEKLRNLCKIADNYLYDRSHCVTCPLCKRDTQNGQKWSLPIGLDRHLSGYGHIQQCKVMQQLNDCRAIRYAAKNNVPPNE